MEGVGWEREEAAPARIWAMPGVFGAQVCSPEYLKPLEVAGDGVGAGGRVRRGHPKETPREATRRGRSGRGCGQGVAERPAPRAPRFGEEWGEGASPGAHLSKSEHFLALQRAKAHL